MAKLRERWEGVSLPGEYLLKRWLSGNDAAGFFETSLAPDGRRAVVKLVVESTVDGAAQMALWRRTRFLRHPNLCELLDCGRATLSGETVLYAVFEYADDTLASALSQAPLTEAEACELLIAVRDGLDYLQAQGLAHPALGAEHVLGVGEAIKLSSDSLREAAPGTPYAEALRTFWLRVSPCTPARSADLLGQALGGEVGAAPAAAPVPAPAKNRQSPDSATRPAAHDGAPGAARPAAPVSDVAPVAGGFPKWILVGAAAVVLLILGLNLRRGAETAAEPTSAPAAAPAASPARGLAETVTKPESKPPESKSTPRAAEGGKGMWRVVAFTYRTRDAAAKRAEQVNQRHPDLEASVFSSKEKRGFYLIALGGPMTREEALRLQKKARAAGMPRDVYIHNFVE